MDPAQFQSFVEKLQQVAERDPAGYRRRVLGLAVLGYAYLAVLILVLLGMFVLAIVVVSHLGAIGIKFVFITGSFLLLVLRAIWVRLDAPTGARVTRNDAAALFDLLDGLRTKLRTPVVDRVLVTSEFNAAVVQVPRLGLFGWYRNYVLLGLPLMKVLTAQQFEAVLAHELGHLAGGHARTAGWIYRLRLMWLRLNVALTQNKHWGAFMVRPFFDWYAPYFHAYSFPLARANEYEADAASARLTTPRSAAQALTAVSVVGSFLTERFWPSVFAQAALEEHPSFAPFSNMPTAVTHEMTSTDTEKWMREALARETSVADTHPALKDRLRAISAAAELLLPDSGNAADMLLGASRTRIESRLDDEWLQGVKPAWLARHQQIVAGKQRLAELAAKSAGETLPTHEALERASLEEDAGAGAAAALEQRRALYALQPESAIVLFALGRQLVQSDDESGVALLKQCVERDAAATAAVSELLRDFFWRRGAKDAAYEWHRRLNSELAKLEAARAKRSRITTGDKFLAHGLDEAAVGRLREQLARIRAIRRAYLARKQIDGPDNEPLFVLGFRITGFMQLHRASTAKAVQQEILGTCEFPGETLIINVDGDNQRFERRLRRCRGTGIL